MSRLPCRNGPWRLAAAALSLLAGASAAQTIRMVPVVVATEEVSSADALRGWAELWVNLQKADARLEVESLEGLLEPVTSQLRTDALEKGLTALKRGEALRKSDGLAAAKEAYLEATQLLSTSDWRRGFEPLVTAQAWKAAASGEQQDASLLFTLRPDFAFPAGALDPTVEANMEAQRAGKAKAARTAFELRSEVPAVVWVDGVLVGVTPVRTPEVVSGRHFITAMAPGYRLLQSEELVGPGSAVDLILEDANEGAAVRAALAGLGAVFRTRGSVVSPRLVELLKVTEVLAVGLSPDGEASALRFDASGKVARAHRKVGPRQLKPGLLALARDAYDAALAAPVAEVPVAKVTSPPVPEVKTPAASTPGRVVPAVLLSVGGAAMVAGGVTWAVGLGQAKEARAIPQIEDERYLQAIGEAQVKAGVGGVFFFAGTASVVVGIVMLATAAPAAPPPPERDEFSVRLIAGPGSIGLSGRF